MQITYQFRLYPTPKQEQLMIRTLRLCQKLYNRAKEQRDTAYTQEGKTVTYAMQQDELPAFKKEFPEYKAVHSQVLQDCLRRLDDAYQRFFRGEAGFPHYKSADRTLSFTYPQPGAVAQTFAHEGSVYLSKIGWVRMHAHRPFDRANVTQINVKRYADGWMANIGVKLAAVEAGQSVDAAVGIDVGLRTFAALSDETKVDNPQHLRRAEKRLRRAQRRLSRKQRGSCNRQKAKRKVAKIHQKVARQRNDFLHKQSYRIVMKHDLIAVEQLKVKNMLRNRRLSKSIADAGWRKFMTYLSYKAERQGKRFVQVPAHGTSQTCICGADVPKTLAIRLHECKRCGWVQDRDIVSAKVILQRALKISA
ncbi:transposase [Paenibacillus riograndensis]|uniref:Transposase n=1 Tax=Paenibacillus riograndensis TaxID=483937 RepID=A0A132UCG4_9BACL|nr:RNA-guided endonuclease TnpB family protein [Paenibacillus riograndensis]KWX81349.1 transposase [Paenibacillus riograndensis]